MSEKNKNNHPFLPTKECCIKMLFLNFILINAPIQQFSSRCTTQANKKAKREPCLRDKPERGNKEEFFLRLVISIVLVEIGKSNSQMII